jgi:hypothetical protein
MYVTRIMCGVEFEHPEFGRLDAGRHDFAKQRRIEKDTSIRE